MHSKLGKGTSDVFRYLSVVGAYEFAGGGHAFCQVVLLQSGSEPIGTGFKLRTEPRFWFRFRQMDKPKPQFSSRFGRLARHRNRV